MKINEILKEDDVSTIFKNMWVNFPSRFKDIEPEEITVSVNQLVPTQPEISTHGIKQYERGQGNFQDSLPEVVKQNDQYLITDGHHRLALEIKNGKKYVNVLLVGTK